jgi:hypothetical protein
MPKGMTHKMPANARADKTTLHKPKDYLRIANNLFKQRRQKIRQATPLRSLRHEGLRDECESA